MKLQFFSAGGTIDKVYFDAKSTFEVGQPQLLELLREANYTGDYEFEALVSKDSLDLTDEDRQMIAQAVRQSPLERVVITHGTDTMIETARLIDQIPGKTVVLTGSLQPARFKTTDAAFNLGSAIAAVQLLPAGAYIVMNGQIFKPEHCRKNRQANRFEFA